MLGAAFTAALGFRKIDTTYMNFQIEDSWNPSK